MSIDLDWIKKLSRKNLVFVYDVLLDIKDQAEFDSAEVVMPLLSFNDRFHQLCPDESLGTSEQHAAKRSQALRFLEKNGLIKHLTLDEGMFIGDTDVSLIPVSIESLDEALAAVRSAVDLNPANASLKSSPIGTVFWTRVHPKIAELARPLFEANHLADAVEASFKEVNDRVKSLVKTRTGKEYDGASLMRQAFSPNGPIISLADLSTASGQNEQSGYMDIFAGAMTGIRNPKAHSNLTVEENRAIHLIHLASLLMFKLDEAK